MMATPPKISTPPPVPIEDENEFPTLQVVVVVCAILIFLLLLLLFSMGSDPPSYLGAGDGRGSGINGEGDGSAGGDSAHGTGTGSSGAGSGAGGDPEDGGKQAEGEESSQARGAGGEGDAEGGSPVADDPSRAGPPPPPDAAGEDETAMTTGPLIDIKRPKQVAQNNAFIAPQPVAKPVAPAPAAAGQEGESAEFFGASADGNSIAYVVDLSSSMSGERFIKARDELIDSVNKLKSDQRVYIVFFNDRSYIQSFNSKDPDDVQDRLVTATPSRKKKLREWIERARPSGGTNPYNSIISAIEKSPDAIFVLSDGDFAHSVVDQITAENKEKIPIHTIGFQTNASTLQVLAEMNRGVFTRVD